MRIHVKMLFPALLLAAAFGSAGQLLAQDATWRVAKSSGEVWLSSSEKPQPVSLTSSETVSPGDTIRTGATGMLLLARGEETMLVSPNSVIDISKSNIDGMSTTIMERAGSILLKVEKRKVNHFEVVTPYLAAVVKGTQFRVSADRGGSNVEVLEGQVDVSGFKSGEQVLLLPGQAAKIASSGSGSLNMSGSGLFNPVRVGPPRTSPLPAEEPKTRTAQLDRSEAPPPAAGATVSDTRTSRPERQTNGSWRAEPDNAWSELKKPAEKFDLMTVGLPASVGMMVALAVMVGRGRKNRKQPGKSERWRP